MSRIKTFKEFLDQRELGQAQTGEYGNSPLKHLEKKVFSLIDQYRESLIKASVEAGEKDDDIHHDIIRKNESHRGILASIAELFSRVYELEKGSTKLKPSFFSDTVFEKVARYAKRKLGYHADEIGEHLRKINPTSLDNLYNIWTPGSWARA
jgi:hypothetical protein